MKLIEIVDSQLHQSLTVLYQNEASFAISWVLTWFSHDRDDLEDIFLIFDFCMASHPASTIYLAAAAVLLYREQVLLAGEDFGQIHVLLKNIGKNIDIDEMCYFAVQLMSNFPIQKVLNNTKVLFAPSSPLMNPQILSQI